jgi:hypothetical protein
MVMVGRDYVTRTRDPDRAGRTAVLYTAQAKAYNTSVAMAMLA